MKSVFRSFYGKITLVFLVIILALGVTQILITTSSFQTFNRNVDQQLNLNLARDMAFELTELLTEELDMNQIGERIHYMMVMNPKIEIYLLDDTGKILAFFAEPGKSVKGTVVDLDPVFRFILDPGTVPILGSDPRQPGKLKPFSAAELSIGESRKGYLYIVIGGEEFDSIASLFKDSYIIRTMVNGSILSIFVAGMIGIILFAFLTKRLRLISTGVSSFEQGDLSHRIQLNTTDEFGQLGSSFNAMADQIESTIEQLKESDTLRRELVANVSHDLRTPLAGIQGYIETILMKPNLDEKSKLEYLEIIHKNTENLNQQINDLFELSKLEAKQIEPNLEPFSMSELAQDMVQKFLPLAEKYGSRIHADFIQDLPFVNADISLIDRVVSNLIKNALEFTPEKGSVVLSLKKTEAGLSIEVSDTGSGISREDMPFIFNRYFKGGKKQRGSRSTGLGLTIAYKILEAHGCELRVQSESGKGTVFNFTLPIA